ncbi:MAG: NAD(P)/FAD-dependent oxidoreductase, partial [Mycoplasmoidaceae bacterium]
MKEKYDVLIIGGGPGGMYASIIGSLLNVSSVIVESNPFLGGQPTQLYAEKTIADYPGFSEILTSELMNGMTNQINSLAKKPEIILNTYVIAVEKKEDRFITKLQNGKIYETDAIIIATGSGNFLPIKNEILERKNYSNIHYIFKDSSIYKNKRVVILGGGDSALDWANFLVERKITNVVSLIHRRSELRARQEKV